MRKLKHSEIQPGMIITALTPRSDRDRSYMGELYYVEAVDFPYMILGHKGCVGRWWSSDADMRGQEWGIPSDEYQIGAWKNSFGCEFPELNFVDQPTPEAKS